MKKSYYEKSFKNGVLIDCCAVDLLYIAFLLQDLPKDDADVDIYDLPTRLMVYYPEKNEPGTYGTTRWDNGVGESFVSADGDSWIVGNQAFMINEVLKKTSWYPIPNNEKGHLAKGMTRIDDTVYAYGMIRSVFKHTGVKQWENLTTRERHANLYADVEASKETFVGDQVGFSALDGFGPHDLYAGGNRGDFWHYDGKAWRRKELPSNADIATITCAPNGQVYVACWRGPVLLGRDERWRIIDDSKHITHSAWFQNRIYFVSHDGWIYTHDEGDDALVEAHFNTAYPEYMHHLIKGMASCDECLVIYTGVQAYAYDGAVWHEIIELPALSKHQ